MPGNDEYSALLSKYSSGKVVLGGESPVSFFLAYLFWIFFNFVNIHGDGTLFTIGMLEIQG
jgi:hypothetical protein